MTDTYTEPNTLDDNMNTNQLTALRIKEERLRLNYTQQAVADHLGLDISNYSRLENGKYEITITKLEAIAEFFKVPIVNFIPSNGSVQYNISNCTGIITSNGTFNNSIDIGQLDKSLETIISALDLLKKNVTGK